MYTFCDYGPLEINDHLRNIAFSAMIKGQESDESDRDSSWQTVKKKIL